MGSSLYFITGFTENYIYLKDDRGEVNMEWESVPTIQPELAKVLQEAEAMLNRVREILPKEPIGLHE